MRTRSVRRLRRLRSTPFCGSQSWRYPVVVRYAFLSKLAAGCIAAAIFAAAIRTDLPAEHISELLVGNLALTVLHWTVDGKRGQLAGWLGSAWKLRLEGALPQ
jgi:hypothetical protein